MMLIHEAITKAIEGGYSTAQLDAPSHLVQAQYFLDTSFWEALVRALGVEGDFKCIHLERGQPHTIQQPLWLYYWHQFNSHLVAGNTPESFFETFAYPPEASP